MSKSMMLVVAVLSLGAALATAQPKKDIGYDSGANAFQQLDAAIAAAKAEDKLVLLISGGHWCIWCHYLAAFLERETAIDAALHDVFVVQKVYVGEQNLNKEFFARLPEAAGAPHFWVLSSGGEVEASQDTLPLEDGAKSYDPKKFLAFVEQWRDRSARR
jgi:thiol:disulfide interchange protein